MRIVFLGSGAFGVPTLEALARAHDVALVVTQPDRPAGRGRKLTPTPIAQFAAEHGLATIKPPRVNAPEVVAQIRRAGPDANVVVAFGQKIGTDVIESPRLGAAAMVNLHASLLPAYRGAAPIHWAIIRGEVETGNTVFSLVDRMDAGDILAAQSTPIGLTETTGELHDRLASMGPDLVLSVMARLEDGTAQSHPQDESLATLAPKLTRADAVIDFTKSADEVRCRINGLTPWPGVSVGCEAGVIKLTRAETIAGQAPPGIPGTMIADGVIATGRGAVRLLEVQPPGKRSMTWADFNHGARLKPGTRFETTPQT